MLWQFLSILSVALANFDVSVDEDTYTASSTLTVSWDDDGNDPSIDSYTTADFLLCAYGSDSKLDCPVTLGQSVDIDGKTETSFDLSTVSTEGPAGSYVVQMTAVGSSKANYVINYGTTWFTVTGFTGAGSALSGNLPAGTDSQATSGGAVSGDLPDATVAVPSEYSNLESPWMTPYIYQHGVTRYAPFQLTPNSTVTAPMTVTRRFSTSAVSTFTAWVKTPLPITTVTPSPSITVTLVPNSASSYSAAYTGRTASRVTPTAVYRQRRWAD